MTKQKPITGKTKLGNWSLSTKGYPRYHSGPYRNQYVHRVAMARKLRRKLKKDEDVHHKDGNKLNYKLRNLKLLGHVEHGYVSAKQHWFMKQREQKERKEWDEYFGEEQS